MIVIIPIISLTLITFLGLWIYDLKEAYQQQDSVPFEKQPIFKYTIYSLALIIGSILFVNYEVAEGYLSFTEYGLYFFSGLISLLISGLWFQHINKLDMYEPEKPIILFLVFASGAAASFLVFPISYIFKTFINTGFDGNFINDLFYSIAGIGIVEEFVKILPILLLARFTKLLNEPFDYLLFGTMSALGFAFIENSMYLYRSELNAIDGRALYASPAHMILTSYICYQWAMAKFIDEKYRFSKVATAFLVSATAHGLYDFWLISESATGFWFISILILLLGMKIWVRLANNLVNISNFFDPKVRFDAIGNKYHLSLYLIAILSFTYVCKSFLYSSHDANDLLLHAVFDYSFLLAFLGINFANITIIHGYLAPVIERRSFSIAHFFPLGINKKNCTGIRLKLFISEKQKKYHQSERLYSQLPVYGTLVRQVVFNGDISFYFFVPEKQIMLNDVWSDCFLITNLDADRPLSSKRSVMAELYGLNSSADLTSSVFTSKMAKRINLVGSKRAISSNNKE